MALGPGNRLETYEILAPLGAGGMGQVWLATDLRLHRKVAIKVLPADLTQEANRVARFQQEARAASALNHPNVCTIHALGETTDGRQFIAMELVEGTTLRSRLGSRLPAREALDIAIQVASALTAAHAAGIVHRDIKPENIMLRPDGVVKVLDFGLAKLTRTSGAAGTVESMATLLQTNIGVVMGTVAYMSPEQARGQEVDARTDIWSLGVVLYEMLTGGNPFAGPSASDVLAAILERDPAPLVSLQPVTPPALASLVGTCLAKDPDRRWRSMPDVQLQLTWIRDSATSGAQPSTAARRIRRRDVAWALCVALALTSGFAAARWMAGGSSPAAERTEWVLSEQPPGVRWLSEPTLSPDGRRIALLGGATAASPRIWLRALDSTRYESVDGDGPLFWSADGHYLGYVSDRWLKKIAPGGTEPQLVCRLPVGTEAFADASGVHGGLAGATWNRTGDILFGVGDQVRSGLYHVAASGGTPRPITQLDQRTGETRHAFPFFLPDGRHFLFTAFGPKPAVLVASLGSDTRMHLIDVNSPAVYAHGFLVFSRDYHLVARPFDPDRLQLGGNDVPIQTTRGVEAFSASASGLLIAQSARQGLTHGDITATNSRLAWFDRAGHELESLSPLGGYDGPRLSRDGTRVAVERFDDTNHGDVWVLDLQTHAWSRLTDHPDRDSDVAWSPAGDSIAFSRENFVLSSIGEFERLVPGPILVKSSLGTGGERVLHQGDGRHGLNVLDWSPDGQFIAHTGSAGIGKPARAWQVGVIGFLPVTGAAPVPEIDGRQPRFSPDGRRIAYVSDETGRDEVYVQGFPPDGRKVAVSAAGGYQPEWRDDGRELYYLTLDRMLMSVPVNADRPLEVGTPTPLFRAPCNNPGWGRNQFQPAQRGQRFVMVVVDREQANPPPLVLLINWAAGLNER